MALALIPSPPTKLGEKVPAGRMRVVGGKANPGGRGEVEFGQTAPLPVPLPALRWRGEGMNFRLSNPGFRNSSHAFALSNLDAIKTTFALCRGGVEVKLVGLFTQRAICWVVF